jgi:hypothetical protein
MSQRVKCRDCAADLEHCHGVAIVHPDGVPDCTETPACGLPANAHWASVQCSETRCGCEQSDGVAEPEARASA